MKNSFTCQTITSQAEGKLYSVVFGQIAVWTSPSEGTTFYAANRQDSILDLKMAIYANDKSVKTFKSKKAAINHIRKGLEVSMLPAFENYIKSATI
jgi:hypothetical protein